VAGSNPSGLIKEMTEQMKNLGKGKNQGGKRQTAADPREDALTKTDVNSSASLLLLKGSQSVALPGSKRYLGKSAALERDAEEWCWEQADKNGCRAVKSQHLPKHMAGEVEEIVKWVGKTLSGRIRSVTVFGSAVREWEGKPEDLDVLIVVDAPREDALKAKLAFLKGGVDLELSDRYGLYPEVVILSKDEVGLGSPGFYYSIVRDGVSVQGGKELFVEALKRIGGNLERDFLKRMEEGRLSLSVAYEFLDMAKEDLELFKRTGRSRRLQSSAENAFRAVIEAVYALFRKHGLPTPRSHEEERRGLVIVQEIYPRHRIQAEYEEIFTRLHDECFYHGRCPKDMEDWIEKVERFLKNVEDIL